MRRLTGRVELPFRLMYIDEAKRWQEFRRRPVRLPAGPLWPPESPALRSYVGPTGAYLRILPTRIRGNLQNRHL